MPARLAAVAPGDARLGVLTEHEALAGLGGGRKAVTSRGRRLEGADVARVGATSAEDVDDEARGRGIAQRIISWSCPGRVLRMRYILA